MYNVGEHTLKALSLTEKTRILRLTMLLHDIGKASMRTTDANGVDHFKGHGPEGKEIAKKILRRLKFDNDTIAQVTHLIYWHDYRPAPEEKAVRRAIHKVGEDLFPLFLKVQRADNLAQSMYLREESWRDRRCGKLTMRSWKTPVCVAENTGSDRQGFDRRRNETGTADGSRSSGTVGSGAGSAGNE